MASLNETACVFCQVVAGDAAASVVLDEERVLAFLDLRQSSEAHVLVIPKLHRRDLREMESNLAAEVMDAIGRIARAVDEAFKPDGMNVWHSIEEAAGQEVFHAHFHLLPRWLGDGLLGIYPEPPASPSRAELDRQAGRIRDALGSVPG